MNKKRLAYGALGLVVAAALVGLAWNFFLRPNESWPSLDEATGPAPTIQVQYDTRNFGWRIGDVVPVTIYVKQHAGTTVEVEGLALDGEFELRGDPQVSSVPTPDGGKLYQIKLRLQSFSTQDERSARISLAWYRDGQRGAQELGQTKISMHASKTWDGKPEIQEGKPSYVQGNHLWRSIGLGVLSLAGIVISVVYWRWQILLLPIPALRKQPPTKEQWAQARFNAAWAHIAAGERDAIWFRRITVTMRRYLGADAILWSQLPNSLRNYAYQKQALTVIGMCERVLFKKDVLTEEELLALHAAFHDIVLKRYVGA